MQILALAALVFMGTALVLFVVMYAFIPRKSLLEERLESLSPTFEEPSYLEKPLSPAQRFLGRLGANVPLRPSEYGKYMKNLVAAGIRREMLPAFIGVKLLLLIALPGAYLFFYGLPLEEDLVVMVLISGILAILGYLLPSVWLGRQVKKRKLQIFHDLPDVLDLMTVCVEAGLSMDAAIIRISNDRQFMYSPLASELKVVTQETRAGKPREEALRDMGERTMVRDLKSFAAMLIQTERLGTSLAQSLRVHSDTLRTIRRQRAEEQAAKTSIKLLFPLVFLIMPALFVVMLMPALLRIAKFLAQM